LKGKAIDINNIKSNVYLQLLDLDIRRKKYIEFLNHGAKCAGAGFLEGQQGTAVVYTTAEMSVAEEALKVLPQYSDPFINADFLSSDGVFSLSLAYNCNNRYLSGQNISKNLRTANLASLQHCGVVKLGLIGEEASVLTRMELYNMILSHRINNGTYVGIKNFYKVRVDNENHFEITCRSYRAGKYKLQLSFIVERFGVVFNQGQAPQVTPIYNR
jgi:hypothetical protein